ncbi:MAG: HAMP domain-containing protein [Myxococcales bacterium]|nr:HAMP domain-containing protein [Myxococcales bacterium]MCB9650470.1 HAMP domain-containing protein [Deltaproteobacteria bacterium]
MKAVLRYLGGRLHRKLFVGFGATIIVTFMMVGLAMHLFSIAVPTPWDAELARLVRFTGHRFAETWHDPAARERLARSMAQDLMITVAVSDVHGERLGTYGPPCAGYELDAPVMQDSLQLGAVHLCVGRDRHRGSGARLAIFLGVLGGVLWLGSALLARRITRPLAHLTRVAEDIGAGRYRARTPVHGNDELSHLARTVNDMAGRIEAQVEDQRTLLATVSHELRTPLGHLRILAELASDPDLPEPDRQHALLDIDGEVQEMDLLVGELLANSRLDFQSVSAQPMEPEVTARRALQRAGLQEVPLVVQADLPAVAADATLIARALSNLLRNAQVHGGGAQLLRVRARDGGVAFEVEDHGPGIPDDAKEAVFRPFHRAPNGARGTLGLGLALVARIADVHGGRAYAEDRPGGGALVGFTCRLGVEHGAPPVESSPSPVAH